MVDLTRIISETSGASLPIEQPSTVNTEKKSNIWTNPIFLWVVIGVVFLMLSDSLYHIWTKPSIDKVQKEANELKIKYESLIKEYESSKKIYNKSINDLIKRNTDLDNEYQKTKKISDAKIAELTKKYINLKKEFDVAKKEYDNILKPKTSKERMDRLRALGYFPIQ